MTVMPDLPPDPNVWVDPNLLQLVGLGTNGDPYLQDGRHLRWFFGRLLGFPREGFTLFRRRNPFEDFTLLRPLLPIMGGQATTEPHLGNLGSLQFASGLGVAKDGGFMYDKPAQADERCLRIDAKPVTLHLGPSDEYPEPHIGPTATDPAAYVLLTIHRRVNSGKVVAEGFYSSGGTLRFQDRSAVGKNLDQLFPQMKADIVDVGHVQWLRSRAERHVARRDIQARHNVYASGCTVFLEPWVRETMLLSGGLLEHIVLTGQHAVLESVQWLPTRLYATAEGWQKVDTYYLPLTDADPIYPNWTAAAGKNVAGNRLSEAPPRALPPWDVAAYPPSPDPAGVLNDLHKRYLDPFERIDQAMRLFLAGELQQITPQALVEIPETMIWDGEAPPAGGSTATFRPFDFLYSAAADPQMARLLGLMTTDQKDASGSWDYYVQADFPTLWLWLMILPAQVEPIIKKLQEAVAKMPLGKRGDALRSQLAATESLLSSRAWDSRVISMATSIERGPEPAPLPPDGLTTTPKPYPARKNVQCEVDVSWNAAHSNLFDEPRKARLFYALRRTGADGDVPLHQKDDETGVALPIVPTADAIAEGRAHVADRTMPAYGPYTWRVSGMDLWGRFSPFADGPANVTDVVAPLAPSRVQAGLQGATASAPAWTSLVVSFDWTTFHATEAPDVVAFDVHVRQGKIASSDNASAATWGRLEHVAGATTAPLRIDRVSGAVLSALPAGLTATVAKSVLSADDGGGDRYTVTIGPVQAPFAKGFARMSAAATAIDAAGNVSAFAQRAVAERVDDTPPPAVVLPGPQFTSYPDARGLAHYRVPLATPAGRRTQVLRATQTRLLESGNITDADFAAMDDGKKVLTLRQLSVAHPDRFTPDHELPYGETATEHDVLLNGLERALTVIAIRQTSETGVEGLWPTDPLAFAVIAVRRAPAPRPPLVLEARPGDRAATLLIALDLSGATEKIRVYRARSAEKSEEIRTMRPVAELDVAGAPAAGITFTDPGLFADIPYFYRLVAAGAAGTRSEATPVIAVKPWSSVPPETPELVSVTKPLAFPSTRQLTFTIARRDQPLTIFRRTEAVPFWDTIDADAGPGDALDLAAHTVTPAGDGYSVLVVDTVPDAAPKYEYFIRVRDARDRRADSAAVEETA